MRKFSYFYVQPTEDGQNVQSVGTLNLDSVVDTKFILFEHEGQRGVNCIIYLNGIGANKLMEFASPVSEDAEVHLAEVPNSIVLSHPFDVHRACEEFLTDKTRTKGKNKLGQNTVYYDVITDWLNTPTTVTDTEGPTSESEE